MNANRDKLPISRGQRVLRYIGAVILSACAVMFVLGLTVLSERLHGLQLVRYWMWCFLLAVGSIVCALWDMILCPPRLQTNPPPTFPRTIHDERDR